MYSYRNNVAAWSTMEKCCKSTKSHVAPWRCVHSLQEVFKPVPVLLRTHLRGRLATPHSSSDPTGQIQWCEVEEHTKQEAEMSLRPSSADCLLRLLFDPEDEGNIFLWTARRCNTEIFLSLVFPYSEFHRSSASPVILCVYECPFGDGHLEAETCSGDRIHLQKWS